MSDIDIFQKMNAIQENPSLFMLDQDSEKSRMISEHKMWLESIRRERPNPETPYKVGIYIRYFNQTKYGNYLAYHKKQFSDTMELCPNWKLVDFYIDNGATAPNMESAPAWRRLIEDCFDGQVNLIITQKVSNVTHSINEITLLSRILAAQNPPIGIYFISEDIFTLASYYKEDLHDTCFLPHSNWQLLPDDDLDNYSEDHEE